MRLLFHPKDSPFVNSGYGLVTRYLAPGIAKEHDLALMCPVGQTHFMGEFAGIPIYPGMDGGYSEPIVPHVYKDFEADFLFQIADVWALKAIPAMAHRGQIRWLLWFPVDYKPVHPHVIDKVQRAFKIYSFSQDGEKRLRDVGLQNVGDYVWLGLNTRMWRPLDMDKYPLTMRSLGFSPETFNIVMVANNQIRKYWERQFEGIALFLREHQVPTRLYVHTWPSAKYGWNMEQLLDYYGLREITNIADPFELTTARYHEMTMVKIYNAADVCLNASYEGFGLAHIESQAVGTPVIALNEGPGPELVKSGILVPPKDYVLYQNWQRKPVAHEKGIADALFEIYQRKGETRWDKGIEFVRENFDWRKHIIPKWLRLLKEVEEEMDHRCLWGPPKTSSYLRRRSRELVVIE